MALLVPLSTQYLVFRNPFNLGSDNSPTPNIHQARLDLGCTHGWIIHDTDWSQSLVNTAGLCHDPFPEISHIVIPTSAPLGLLHHPLLGIPNLHWSVPITPDQVPGASTSRIWSHSQNLGRNAPPQPWGCGYLPRSCGQHVMIMQPCVTHATSSAGHLASRPGTWGFQPSFFWIYFYLMAC